MEQERNREQLNTQLPPPPMVRLRQQWQVQERPFASTAPVVGPLIVWLRTFWNNIATLWYVRPLLQQQNQYNHAVVAGFEELAQRHEEYDERLIAADREGVQLARQVAELTVSVVQMQKRIVELEAALAAGEREKN